MSVVVRSCGTERNEAYIGIFMVGIWKRVVEILVQVLRVLVCVCRVFPSVALQMIVEFPNDKNSGHCSNIYISPIMFGCDVQATSFPSCSKQLRTDSFAVRNFY